MRTSMWAIVGLIAAHPFMLDAQGPAFDCTKAQGQVEQLVCKDAALAALDHRLDEVFKAALAKARDKVVATFFDTEPPTARLERGDRTVMTYVVSAASGAKARRAERVVLEQG